MRKTESAVGRSKINKRQDLRPDSDVSTSEATTFARYLPGIHAIRESTAAPPVLVDHLRRRLNCLAIDAIGHSSRVLYARGLIRRLSIAKCRLHNTRDISFNLILVYPLGM